MTEAGDAGFVYARTDPLATCYRKGRALGLADARTCPLMRHNARPRPRIYDRRQREAWAEGYRAGRAEA